MLNRSSSPTHHDALDPEKEKVIAEKLQFNSFHGYEVEVPPKVRRPKKTLKQSLHEKIMEDFAASVTLKDGWRKVLLPSLDLRNQRHTRAEETSSPQETQPVLKKSPRADPASVNFFELASNKLDPRGRREVANYETNMVRNLVNETNVAGRQSVRNLLQIYTPKVRANGDLEKLAKMTRANSKEPPVRLLPPLSQHLQTPEPQRTDQILIRIEKSSKRGTDHGRNRLSQNVN